jgi:hypothetical protein
MIWFEYTLFAVAVIIPGGRWIYRRGVESNASKPKGPS